MKLNQEQLDVIDVFLNRMELIHVDLRHEVFAHMVSSIEQRQLHQNLNFEESFAIETKNWENDLDNSYSSWLGLFWRGPKLMIDKCSKKTTAFFWRIALAALGLAAVLFSLNQSTELVFWYTHVLGYSYLIELCCMILLWFKIKASGFESTYKFLYKAQAVGFGFVYLTFNPLWSNMFKSIVDDKFLFTSYFTYSFWFGVFYYFWHLYSSHMNLKERQLVK